MKSLLVCLLYLLTFSIAYSQSVAINNNGAPPDQGAILDISSNSKGLLIPRMTYSNRVSLSASTGMMVYQTNSNFVPLSLAGFYIFDGAIWKRMARADEITGGGSTPGWTITGDDQYSNVTGNVGIGTSSPTSKFHLYGDMNIDAASNPIIQFKNAGIDKGFIQLSGNNLRVGTNASNTSGKFAIRVNNADRMIIDSLGQVGIGISSPDEYLHVRNKIRISPIGSTAQAYLQLYGNPNNPFNIYGPTGISFHNWLSNGSGGYDYIAKYKMEFDGGLAERLNLSHVDHESQLVLNKDGEVGIGKVPNEKLDIAGNTRLWSTSPILKFQTTENLSLLTGSIEFNSSSNQNKAKIGYSQGALKLSGRENPQLLLDDLVLDNNNVGINNATPLTKLHIKGGQDAGINASSNGYIMNGDAASVNLIIDNNEIMSRNGTSPGTMFLQNDGGTLNVGAVSYFNQKININASGEVLKINGTEPYIGFYQNGSYKSFIHQTGNTFFIGNNAGNIKIDAVGQVAIGNVNNAASAYKFTVAGKMACEEVKVALSADWPDYVFSDDYNLSSLSKVEAFIQQNNHLPNIPSASEVAKSGFELGEMNIKLLEKIEELTLHLIAQNKKIMLLEEKVNALTK